MTAQVREVQVGREGTEEDSLRQATPQSHHPSSPHPRVQLAAVSPPSCLGQRTAVRPWGKQSIASLTGDIRHQPRY